MDFVYFIIYVPPSPFYPYHTSVLPLFLPLFQEDFIDFQILLLHSLCFYTFPNTLAPSKSVFFQILFFIKRNIYLPRRKRPNVLSILSKSTAVHSKGFIRLSKWKRVWSLPFARGYRFWASPFNRPLHEFGTPGDLQTLADLRHWMYFSKKKQLQLHSRFSMIRNLFNTFIHNKYKYYKKNFCLNHDSLWYIFRTKLVWGALTFRVFLKTDLTLHWRRYYENTLVIDWSQVFFFDSPKPKLLVLTLFDTQNDTCPPKGRFLSERKNSWYTIILLTQQ